jgi:hypothetical protein
VGPDWLGSPQHVVGGCAVALLAALTARPWTDRWWLLAGFAVGAAAAAELVVELIEYPLLHPERSGTPYFDLIADLAASLAGGILGAAIGLALRRRGA